MNARTHRRTPIELAHRVRANCEAVRTLRLRYVHPMPIPHTTRNCRERARAPVCQRKIQEEEEEEKKSNIQLIMYLIHNYDALVCC